MKFNEFYSLTIVHSRDIILVKGVDYMNITKQKSQKTFDKQAADYDTNIQGEHARKLYKPIIVSVEKDGGKITLPVPPAHCAHRPQSLGRAVPSPGP